MEPTITTKHFDYEVGETENGKSLFAIHNIKKGTVLFTVTGKYLNFAQVLSLDESQSNCLQVDLNTYILPHYPFFLSNHSCTPNCGINHKLEYFAIADIQKGEELVWDYSTSMLERHWTMKCNCKTAACRHTIEDFDRLPVDLQKEYLALDIVMSYIVRFLEITRD